MPISVASDARPLKRLLIHFCVLLGLLSSACQPAAALVTPRPGPSYTLMVLHGSGGGHYPAGSTVHIWANPYQQGWTFDGWTGDTQPVPDVRAMHATITMPARDVRLEAT